MISPLAGGQLGILAEARRLPASSPLLVGLVAAWHFDEESGNALDSSGNDLHLTNAGSATFGPGKLNNGAILVASDVTSFFYRESEALLQISMNFGVAVWVKKGAGDIYQLICKDQISGSREWGLYNSSGAPVFVVYNGGSNYRATNPASSWYDGNWHLLVGTLDNGQTKISLDGALFTVGQTAPAVTVGTSRIGIGNRYGNDRMTGSVDAAYLFSRALSQDDVDLLWNAGNGIQIP